MKLRFLTFGLVLVVGGLSYYVWFGNSDAVRELELQKRQIIRAARGTPDDPIARERWEWMRLRDPKTNEIPHGMRAKELAFAAMLPTKESVWRKGLVKAQAPFTWTKRGPHNVGGRTRGFAADSRNANILLAGGISGGMWRSTDDGVSWAKTTDAALLHSVTCLVQDPRSGQQDTWYAGSGERSGNSTSGGGALFLGGGIFKSTNNGVTWSQMASTNSGTPHLYDNAFDFVNRIAIDPSDGELYVAASNVIEKSTNGGTSWSIVRGTLANNSATDVQVTTTGVVYAALNSGVTNPGIWRSPDGNTWTSITPAGFPSTYGRIFIAIAPSNQNAVYFLVQGTNGTDGVDQINNHQIWKYTYVSGDGSGVGGTWVNKGASLPNQAGVSDNAEFSTQVGYDITVHIKPDNENFVIIGGVNLYRTTDFSASTPTWTRIGGYAGPLDYLPYLNHHPDQHSGFFRTGSNLIFYSGHDGGLTKTSDVTAGTVSWTFLNNGYTTSQFYTLAVEHATSGNNVLVGGTQDNGTWWTNSTSGTVSWVDLFGGDGGFCAVSNTGTYYYVEAQWNSIANSVPMYRLTLDAGGNWTSFAYIEPQGSGYALFINPFVLDPNNTNMMYMIGDDRIWRNSDLTAIPNNNQTRTTVNWTELSATATTANPITAIGVSKSPANRVYFGNSNGDLFRLDAANTATSSTIPTDITGTQFPFGYMSCIAVNPSNGNQVLVAFSNYVTRSLFWSTDSGTTWTDVGGNLEQNVDGTGNGPSVRWAAIVPTSQGTTYFAATSVGVYSTTTLNGSSTVWTQEGSTTIGNVVVDMIDYRTSDGLVAAATHGNGVYSTNVIVSAPTARPSVPTAFVLSQNFPNPFNPNTTIQYDLPERAIVKLSVFDLAGREIAVLVDREQEPGQHEARWDARDSKGSGVSSGVYFYRLTAVGKDNSVKFARTEKMTYVK